MSNPIKVSIYGEITFAKKQEFSVCIDKDECKKLKDIGFVGKISSFNGSDYVFVKKYPGREYDQNIKTCLIGTFHCVLNTNKLSILFLHSCEVEDLINMDAVVF